MVSRTDLLLQAAIVTFVQPLIICVSYFYAFETRHPLLSWSWTPTPVFSYIWWCLFAAFWLRPLTCYYVLHTTISCTKACVLNRAKKVWATCHTLQLRHQKSWCAVKGRFVIVCMIEAHYIIVYLFIYLWSLTYWHFTTVRLTSANQRRYALDTLWWRNRHSLIRRDR